MNSSLSITFFGDCASNHIHNRDSSLSNLCSHTPLMSPACSRPMGPKHTHHHPPSLFPLERYPQPPCPRLPPALIIRHHRSPHLRGHKTRIILLYVLVKSFPLGWDSDTWPQSDSGIGPHYGMCWLILRVWLHSQSLSFHICTLRVILPAPSHVL